MSHEKFDVTIVRWVDGYRIVTEAAGLNASEVMARKMEEKMLPGELASFTRKPHDHEKHAVKYD